MAGANSQRIDLISANVRLLPGDGVRASARGAIRIQKPVEEAELAAAVRQALARASRKLTGSSL